MSLDCFMADLISSAGCTDKIDIVTDNAKSSFDPFDTFNESFNSINDTRRGTTTTTTQKKDLRFESEDCDNFDDIFESMKRDRQGSSTTTTLSSTKGGVGGGAGSTVRFFMTAAELKQQQIQQQQEERWGDSCSSFPDDCLTCVSPSISPVPPQRRRSLLLEDTSFMNCTQDFE